MDDLHFNKYLSDITSLITPFFKMEKDFKVKLELLYQLYPTVAERVKVAKEMKEQILAMPEDERTEDHDEQLGIWRHVEEGGDLNPAEVAAKISRIFHEIAWKSIEGKLFKAAEKCRKEGIYDPREYDVQATAVNIPNFIFLSAGLETERELMDHTTAITKANRAKSVGRKLPPQKIQALTYVNFVAYAFQLDSAPTYLKLTTDGDGVRPKLGLEAKRTISAGTRLWSEHVYIAVLSSEPPNAIAHRFFALNNITKRAVLVLPDHHTVHEMVSDKETCKAAIHSGDGKSLGKDGARTASKKPNPNTIFELNHFKTDDQNPTASGSGSAKVLGVLHALPAHSCVPNTCIVFDPKQNRLTAHAIRQIEAGEIVTISYIDHMMPREARQKALYDAGREECNCAACALSSEHARECENKKCKIIELEAKGAKWHEEMYTARREVLEGQNIIDATYAVVLENGSAAIALKNGDHIAVMEWQIAAVAAWRYCAGEESPRYINAFRKGGDM